MSEKKVTLNSAAQEEADLVAEQQKHGINVQHHKHSTPQQPLNAPQHDYMSWSIGSLFLCFCWGILAFLASNKVRKYNDEHNFHEAARYSRIAYRHNVSALACLIITIGIFGIPWAVALAVQGNINNYPSAREFFG